LRKKQEFNSAEGTNSSFLGIFEYYCRFRMFCQFYVQEKYTDVGKYKRNNALKMSKTNFWHRSGISDLEICKNSRITKENVF